MGSDVIEERLPLPLNDGLGGRFDIFWNQKFEFLLRDYESYKLLTEAVVIDDCLATRSRLSRGCLTTVSRLSQILNVLNIECQYFSFHRHCSAFQWLISRLNKHIIVVNIWNGRINVSSTGNIGTELSYNNVGMFISSDAGNNWRQVSVPRLQPGWSLVNTGSSQRVIQLRRPHAPTHPPPVSPAYRSSRRSTTCGSWTRAGRWSPWNNPRFRRGTSGRLHATGSEIGRASCRERV